MQDATVLKKENWPKSAEARILFGDREIIQLSKSVKLINCHNRSRIQTA